LGVRPGEAPDPRLPAPRGLRTDWGRQAPAGPDSSLAPGEADAPDGALAVPSPGAPESAPGGEAQEARPPVSPQYRRYVDEYLRALAAGER
jgi:hypothetical protein